ncbi:MAG: hypothetical protein AB1473_03945 [Thermodesulfobacteriota bacterium]
MKTSARRDVAALMYGGEKRFFQCPGVAGACLRPRRTNDRSFPEIGDSLLMDFGHSFFAVADGSGRSGGASTALLVKFDQMIQRLSGHDPLQAYPAEKVGDIIRKIEMESESILQTISLSESSTLTGILIIHTDEGLRGIVLHSGDSLLFQFVPGDELKQMSKTNFWMIGRSSRLYQIDDVNIPPGTIFVLTTDGISDLVFPGSTGRDGCLTKLLGEVGVEEVPERLLSKYDVSPLPVDDLGMVVLKPELLPFVGRTVMMSGSTEGEPLLPVEHG